MPPTRPMPGSTTKGSSTGTKAPKKRLTIGDLPGKVGGAITKAPGEIATLARKIVPALAVELPKSIAKEAYRTNIITGKASIRKLVPAAVRSATAGKDAPAVARKEFAKLYGKEAAAALEAGDVEGALAKALPFSGAMTASVGRTGSRLLGAQYGTLAAPLTKEGRGKAPHEAMLDAALNSRFARDYSENPVGSLVEDAANLSLVAGPVAGAAGRGAAKAAAAGNTSKAASLQALEQSLRGAEHKLNMVAGAPLYPYQKVAKAVAGAAKASPRLKAVGERAAQVSIGRGDEARTIGERIGDRRLIRDARAMRREQGAEAAATQESVIRGGMEFEALLPDVDAQAAAIIAMQAETAGLGPLQRLAPEVREQALKDAFERMDERSSASPRAVAIAEDFAAGRLDPELAGRMEQAIDAQKATLAVDEARKMAGIGRPSGPLSPEQLGDQPMTGVVEKATFREGQRAERATENAVRLRMRADEAQGRLGAAQTTADAARGARGQRVEAGLGRVAEGGERLAKARQDLTVATAKAKEAEAAIVGGVESTALRQARSELERSVRAARRSTAEDMRRQATAMEVDLGEVGGVGRPARPIKGQQQFRGAMSDYADEIDATLGARKAGHTFWQKDGTPLDVYLDSWGQSRGLASGDTAGALASLTEHMGLAQELRTAAHGLVGAGASGRALDTVAAQWGDASVYDWLTDTPTAAASALVSGGAKQAASLEGLAAGDAGWGAALSGTTKGQAERSLAGSLRAGEDLGRAKGRLQAAGATIEREVGRAEVHGARLGEREAVAHRATLLADKAERVAMARSQRWSESVAKAEASVEAAPARYRPAIIRAREASESLRRQADEVAAGGDRIAADFMRVVADDVATSLSDMVARGIDPAYIEGGLLPVIRPGKIASLGGKAERRLPQVRRAASEKVRESAEGPRTAKAVTYLRAKEAGQVAENVAAAGFVERFGTKGTELFNTTFKAERLAKVAADAGYTAWNPAGIFEKVSDHLVTTDHIFVRTAVYNDMRNAFGKGGDHAVFKAMRRTNQALNLPILRLSPRWQVGNAVSQMMQMTLGAGMTPAEIARFGAEARRSMKQRPVDVARRFGDTGFFSEEHGWLRDQERNLGPIGKLSERSAALNEWVDRWGKETVYLSKRGKGFSDEAAVKRALEVQIDMSKMSSAERNIVRAFAPYYPWVKHVTQLMLRLPLEHPTRVAWTMHLTDLYSDDDSNLPDWLEGAIPLGDDRYLPVQNIVNPFGDVGGSPVFSPGGALRSLSPAMRLGAAAGLGRDLSKGGEALTRPRGTEVLDPDTGKPKSTGLLGRPKELGYVVGQSFPQSRALIGAASKPVARYQTGQPIVIGGREIPSGKSRLSAVASLAGVPLPQRVNVAEMNAAADKKRKAAAASLARSRGRSGGDGTSRGPTRPMP